MVYPLGIVPPPDVFFQIPDWQESIKPLVVVLDAIRPSPEQAAPSAAVAVTCRFPASALMVAVPDTVRLPF